MNQKELNEIRRRLKPERSAIGKVYGCFVSAAGGILSYIDSSLGIMPSEESGMYLSILKKTLSGTLGKNLIDIEFSTKQVMEGGEHAVLQSLNTSALEDEKAREELYRRIISSVDSDGKSYVILLAHDCYDVPYIAKDESKQSDASEADSVFSYFICCVCPVNDAQAALKYFAEQKEFHVSSTGSTVSAPELGFMFPVFNDRAADIYHTLFYSKNAKELPEEFISSVFGADYVMSAAEQKDTFDSTLSEALGEECSFDVVQTVHEQLRACIEDHKESKSPELPEISVRDVESILKCGGVSEKTAEAFKEKCCEQFGEDAVLNPKNIIDSKKFEVKTAEVKISVAPDSSYLVETRVIDGKKFILIPADGGVEVNGITVTV